ncbi:ESPR-type extended signal peptide-containing protein [Xanthomonas sp. 60]
MNCIYRIVWNAAIGKWVVASELATGRRKKAAGARTLSRLAALGLLALSLPSFASDAEAPARCERADGVQGVINASGDCVPQADVAADARPQARTIGTQAVVDDRYVKINASGAAASADGIGSIAIGGNAQALADTSGGMSNAVSVGTNATTRGDNAVAIGYGARATSQSDKGVAGSVALGGNSSALGWNATAVGFNAAAAGDGAVALGRGAGGTADATVALGDSANASAEGAMALGGSTSASASGAVALGRGASATRADTVSVGNSTLRRKVVNVAAGTQANDAVIVQQLRASVQTLGGGATVAANGSITGPVYSMNDGSTQTTVEGALTSIDNGLTQSRTTLSRLTTDIDAGRIGLVQQAAAGADLTVGAGTDGGAVDFTGTAGTRRLAGVAAATADDEAVNLAQLKGTAQSVASALGGGARVAADGTVIAPSYAIGGTTYRDAGSALTDLDGRVTGNAQDLSDIRDALDEGSRYFKANGSGVNDEASASGDRAIAVGSGARATAAQGLAIGSGARAGTGENAIAIGANANATGANSIALGAQATADRDNVVSVGWGMGGNGTRQIINVANGTEATDVVNVQQLKPVVAGLGGGAAHDATTGAVTGPRYSVQGGQFDNVGDALGQLDGSLTSLDATVTRHEGSLVSLREDLLQLGEGSAGLVRQATPDAAVTVAAGTGGTAVDVRGTDGMRQLKGVADGSEDNDAVNVGQLATAVEAVRAGGNRYLSVQGANDGSDDAQAGGMQAVAVGAGARADGQASVALGQGAQAVADNSVALGAGSIADRANTVAIGAAGSERQLTHVADGTEDTDAVNLRQLKAAGLVADDGSLLDAVTYDSGSNRGAVTFGGTNGTVLGNVADGRIASGSREAVNGGQIATLRDELQGRIGDLDARVTGLESGAGTPGAGAGAGQNPPYYDAKPQPGEADGEQPAQAAGHGAVAAGAGAQATADNSVALGAGSVADRENTVAVGHEGGERQITHVAAGVQATDAANVGQLQQGISDAKGYTDERVQDAWNGLEQRLNRVNRQANRGIAASAALAPMTPYLPGKTTLNANIANYRSETAMGVGVSRWSDDGRLNVNGGASMARGDKPIFRMGVGVVLGD